ncbi:hypothetical protein HQ571_01590 [Candidatus Kuenenbacteria bacterium]|nr:hypothetical protein [Candidatus Kuenenbacteria bacterium]
MKTCITCETKIVEDKDAIEKHDVNFCSKKCLEEYEKKLKKMGEIVDWDDCC